MNAAQQTALALDRRLRERTAGEVHRRDGITVVRDDALIDVHYLNAVLVHPGAPVTDGDRTAAIAERELPERPEHHVVFDDGDLGDRIADELAPSGWERERTLFMALAAGTVMGEPDPRAREISEADARVLETVSLAEEVPAAAVASGLLHRLVLTAQRRRAAAGARCFGAGEGSGVQSMATLFLDDAGGRRVAMIESVGTLVAHRERGLARAVIGAAIAAAQAWQAELILVPADADDWPQVMYARLGFAPLLRQVALTRRAPGG